VGALSFEVMRTAGSSPARAGRLVTPHGDLETPAFFPVGTYASIRGISPSELRSVGVQGVLCNTYHLYLRPGEQVVANMGGLHSFMAWAGPILTDSGGFQIHSLDRFARCDDAGVRFKSPIDGSSHFLSPERCIDIQEQLGADLIVALDHFEPVGKSDDAERARSRALMERTLRWAERCLRARTRGDRWLFGIVQGGGFADLRAESATRTHALGFDAYAIGGLGLGESAQRRHELLEASLAPLPTDRPRYMMGIGRPADLVGAVQRGVDLFDCVLPTRNGRHGAAFTSQGPVNLRNARFREDSSPVDPGCDCPCCKTHSRGYLHHLFKIGEVLGARMLALHNIAYYMKLMVELRGAILRGELESWCGAWSERQASFEGTAGTEPA
jgi:queuine tRNA-ribosyltransferase